MGLQLFIGSLILTLGLFTGYIVLRYLKTKDVESILKNTGIFFLSLTIILFVGLSIAPYLLQQKDQALIQEYTKNIETYQQYSKQYADSARQQIEDYQELQSELAGRATIQQLQFWAEQEDEVGNALTNKIREFQGSILKEKLAINAAKARIEIRKKNKWFFFL